LQNIIPSLPTPAEYDSVPAGSPSVGNDTNNRRLNYVASFPVTSIKYGLQVLAPYVWGAQPDMVLSGPNVGANTGWHDQFSGTIGVAAYASSTGIPAVAFSGSDSNPRPYTALQPGDVSHLYSALSIYILSQLLGSGKPYLLPGTFLNVNFPEPSAACPTVGGFKFVLTKSLITSPGITCGPHQRPMPVEETVRAAGCSVSITAMTPRKPSLKVDASPDVQQTVQQKLAAILSCFGD